MEKWSTSEKEPKQKTEKRKNTLPKAPKEPKLKKIKKEEQKQVIENFVFPKLEDYGIETKGWYILLYKAVVLFCLKLNISITTELIDFNFFREASLSSLEGFRLSYFQFSLSGWF